MRGTIAAVAFAAAIAAASRAAPCPPLARRQAAADSEDADTFDAAWDAWYANYPEDAPAGWSADSDSATHSSWTDVEAQPDPAPAPAAAEQPEPEDTTNNSNLVGNSLTQIDDSVNVSDTNIEYPGNSELTGNTGTAVSGDNNDIMPIINAPVTVIINSGEKLWQQQHNQAHQPQLPPGAPPPGAPPPALPQPQQPLPPQAPALAQDPADPFSQRIRQMIAYALSVSQGHI